MSSPVTSKDAGRKGPGRIRCGVAGWSYPDWEGVVYPRGTKDKLAFIARFVDMIEVNSTFYRPPDRKTSASWAERTRARPGFFFSAKLHQDITHRHVIEPATERAFHEGLGPLMESGKLSHLLAQFRYDFDDRPEHRGLLARIKESFGVIAEVVVEVRHASWESPGALAFLESLGVTVANLDYPLGHDSFRLQDCRIGANGYLRLHGRNRKAWFDKNAGRDATYDYYYSRAELEGIRRRALLLAGSFRTLTIVANNHFRGKELANALELKSMITGEKVEAPPGLVAAYPALAEAVARSP
jgi:uncharacterized protein YecE (DUF72 family)